MSLADLLPLREREDLATFTTGGTPVGVGDGGHGQIDEGGRARLSRACPSSSGGVLL